MVTMKSNGNMADSVDCHGGMLPRLNGHDARNYAFTQSTDMLPSQATYQAPSSIQPSLTLSMNGVQFKLIPSATFGNYNASGGSSGTVTFQQDPTGDMILNLANFSGTLRVASSNNPVNVTPVQYQPYQQQQRQYYPSTASPNIASDPRMIPPYNYINGSDITPKSSKVTSKTNKSSKKRNVSSKKSLNDKKCDIVKDKIVKESNICVVPTEGEKNMNKKRSHESIVQVMEETKPSESPVKKTDDIIEHGQSQSLLVETESELHSVAQHSHSQTLVQLNTMSNTIDDSDEEGTNNERKESTSHKIDEKPSKVQKILEEETVQSESESDDEVRSHDISKRKDSSHIVVESPASKSVDKDGDKPNEMVVESSKPFQEPINNEYESPDQSSPVTTTPLKGHEPPSARWGHTLTAVGNDRIVVYGGQSFCSTTSLPSALHDVYVYDLKKYVWFKPFNCEGIPRQWHTSTFLPDRNLLISFGGETPNKTGKATKITDSIMVLDTEIMLWYPPSITGESPGGRAGHTATLLPKTGELVLFGGIGVGKRWLNSVAVLDSNRWLWTTPKIYGSAPKPRTYHCAVAIGGPTGNRIVYFGGNNADASFNTVHVLEVVPENYVDESDMAIEIEDSNVKGKKAGSTKQNVGSNFVWKHPTVTGDIPRERTGMTATLLPDNKTILIHGGWDPNMEDEETQNIISNDEEIIFGDTYLLDTEKWEWSKGPNVYFAVFPSNSVYMEDGGPKRVGHEAVIMNVGDDNQAPQQKQQQDSDGNDNDDTKTTEAEMPSTKAEILIFGGRIPGDRFAGDFQVITVD